MERPADPTIPLFRRLREARRLAGLTQAALAREAGCMQSAISMLESGRMDAVARPTLEKLCGRLGVPLPVDEEPPVTVQTLPRTGARFCPNPDCPSNYPYRVGEDVLFRPRGDRATGTHCPLCGEVLASHCAACDAPADPSAACCTQCGRPLVAAPFDLPSDPDAWIAERQRRAQALAAWANPVPPG